MCACVCVCVRACARVRALRLLTLELLMQKGDPGGARAHATQHTHTPQVMASNKTPNFALYGDEAIGLFVEAINTAQTWRKLFLNIVVPNPSRKDVENLLQAKFGTCTTSGLHKLKVQMHPDRCGTTLSAQTWLEVLGATTAWLKNFSDVEHGELAKKLLHDHLLLPFPGTVAPRVAREIARTNGLTLPEPEPAPAPEPEPAVAVNFSASSDPPSEGARPTGTSKPKSKQPKSKQPKSEEPEYNQQQQQRKGKCKDHEREDAPARKRNQRSAGPAPAAAVEPAVAPAVELLVQPPSERVVMNRLFDICKRRVDDWKVPEEPAAGRKKPKSTLPTPSTRLLYLGTLSESSKKGEWSLLTDPPPEDMEGLVAWFDRKADAGTIQCTSAGDRRSKKTKFMTLRTQWFRRELSHGLTFRQIYDDAASGGGLYPSSTPAQAS